MTNKTLEIVTFRTCDQFSSDEIVAAATSVMLWLRLQPGFLSRTFGKSPEGEWVDCVTWASLDSATSAAEKMMKEESVGGFMQTIIPESVVMRHFQVEFAT
jgi:hypothetical protein